MNTPAGALVNVPARTHLRGLTADNVMQAAIAALLAHGSPVTPTNGSNRELWGAVLELDEPRARLSRSATRGKMFSALGELCWYLSGSEDLSFIRYYVEKYPNGRPDGTTFGAYGPRLRDKDGIDQVDYVIARLRDNRSSRRAVVQVYDARDGLVEDLQPPCTCTLQFLFRDDRLNLVVHMRSNDAYMGLPHDLFAFTMLQELVARSVGVPVGCYVHMVGSLHLYDRDAPAARDYLEEGLMATAPIMPEMPGGDPWTSVGLLLVAEEVLRADGPDTAVELPGEPYWADLVRLLQIFALTHKTVDRTHERRTRLDNLRRQLVCREYATLVQERIDSHEET